MAMAESMQSTNPPQKPSHDFLGEIRSKRRCFPIRVPTQNAPVSLSHINMNIAKSINGFSMKIKLSKDRGNATNNCPIKDCAQFSSVVDDLIYSWARFLIIK